MAEKFPLMELIMGILSELNAGVKREPVAYLYNGVRLPALPEWDRETYPYAWITYYISIAHTFYNLVFSQSAPIYDDSSKKLSAEKCRRHTCQPDATQWTFANELDSVSYLMSPPIMGDYNDFVWTSVDIVNTDGILFKPASEPIPVYE